MARFTVTFVLDNGHRFSQPVRAVEAAAAFAKAKKLAMAAGVTPVGLSGPVIGGGQGKASVHNMEFS